MTWPCCNSHNVVVPVNPCSGSIPCQQITDAACVQYNGTLTCISGANPRLDSILEAYCLGITNLATEITFLQGDQVFIKKIILTPTLLYTIFSSPVTLIAAPGAGKFIQILSIYGTFVHLNPAYNLNGNTMFVVGYTGGTWLLTDIHLIASSGDKQTAFTFTGVQSAAGIENLPVIISTDAADLLTGAGTMNVYITYKIVTL